MTDDKKPMPGFNETDEKQPDPSESVEDGRDLQGLPQRAQAREEVTRPAGGPCLSWSRAPTTSNR